LGVTKHFRGKFSFGCVRVNYLQKKEVKKFRAFKKNKYLWVIFGMLERD
jgi:hypothetical protein